MLLISRVTDVLKRDVAIECIKVNSAKKENAKLRLTETNKHKEITQREKQKKNEPRAIHI